MRKFLALVLILGLAIAQQKGTQKQEYHPEMPIQSCQSKGNCQTESTKITIDANWRWVHETTGYANCYTGNEWNPTDCPDDKTCAQKCAIDGVDQNTWTGTYGIQAQSGRLQIGFVTQGPYSKNIGSRVFLMEDEGGFKLFKLKNKEFTFDVDDSKMPCGLNGALYFSQMMHDGGMSEFAGNMVGAEYGTGYCDAQCPHDIKFINGEGNSEGWKPSPDDKNAGAGKYGTCCMEMDIWEANTVSTAFTAHPCSVEQHYRCSGEECGDSDQRYDGVCDKDGCDLNTYRVGNHNFYGEGSNFQVDSSRPFTVVTQFITSDGTDNGDLSEIRRLYVQDGKVINTPKFNLGGKDYDSITDEFCDAQKQEFGDNNQFKAKGGLKQMGKAFEKGAVLVMSLWDDHAAHMLWLDSDYPTDKDPSTPGVARGTCSTDSGNPDDVENQHPDAYVVFSNIKYGAIGSTYNAVAEEE